jgi:hypothetical protein
MSKTSITVKCNYIKLYNITTELHQNKILLFLIDEYLKDNKTTLLPGLYLSKIQFSLVEEFINKFKISNSWKYVESVSYISTNFSCTLSANILVTYSKVR